MSTYPLIAISRDKEEPGVDDVQENGRFSAFYEITGDEDSQGLPGHKHKQAAILLHKGQYNEKFSFSVNSRRSELAYRIVHHPAYLWFNFFTALGLLLLAVAEEPSIYKPNEHRYLSIVFLVLELILLLLLGLNMVLRLIWIGSRLFVKSRGIFISILIVIMSFEAFLILTKSERHIRFTRAFRVLFLLDTFLMSGVRRVVRQILVCMKYIFDVMLVLFFLIAVFSIMGYFFFAQNNMTYFNDLDKSFVSLLITLTTANHPDVFLESYSRSPVAPLFFIVYMFITLYYFSNVLLAVVFAKFKEAEKEKYKKLYLHRRKALKEAFRLLKCDNGISFIDFLCCMQQFRPQITTHEAMCIFKSLQQSPEDMSDNYLCWDEFSGLYENLGLKWVMIHKSGYEVSWYDEWEFLSLRIKELLKKAHDAVRHWLFDSIMTFIVIANLLYLIIFISLKEGKCEDPLNRVTQDPLNRTHFDDQFCAPRAAFIGSFVFNIIYVVEICLRLFLNGPLHYFRKWYNSVDFLLVMVPFACLIAEALLVHHYLRNTDSFNPMISYLAIARPLKLLRIFKLKRNYLYLVRIMIVLVERMISVLFLLLVVFYFFSIIGMEAFTGKNNTVFPNCCHNAWYGVGSYYQNNGSIADDSNLYWLNTFDNLWRSYVTLYELMVVNNWFIIMEGFVSTTSSAARVYFILFWITTTLVVNTAIVYILDAFESGILALNIQNQTDKNTEGSSDLKKVIRLQLKEGDIELMEDADRNTTQQKFMRNFSIRLQFRRYKTLSSSAIRRYKGEFRGKRIMNNHDLRQFIYNAEVEMWREEFDQGQDSDQAGHEDSSTKWWKAAGKYVWKKTRQTVYYFLG